MTSLPISLVVTSHARPELLDEALGSCVDGGVQNIIITATGITPEMRAKFATLKAIKRDIVIVEHHDSTTNNQAWLAGIEAAQTDWVAILHDDDLLLPDYSKLAAQIIAASAPFGVVQAVGHGLCRPYTDDRVGGVTGLVHTNAILKVAVKPGSLSISPIRGIFNRYDMIAWLTTGESLPPECFYRPGFVVGNDLLIWLQACDKYPQFYNVAIPGVSYGHWKGSTTVKDLETEKRLFGIYAKTRSWYLERKLWQDRVNQTAPQPAPPPAEKPWFMAKIEEQQIR